MAGHPTNPLPLREFAKVDLGPFKAVVEKYVADVVANFQPLVDQVRTNAVASEIVDAAARAVAKHGDQSHLPDGTGPDEKFSQLFQGDGAPPMLASEWALLCKYVTDMRADDGDVTWFDILLEEIAESSEASDWQILRGELLDAGAVILNWIIAGDKR